MLAEDVCLSRLKVQSREDAQRLVGEVTATMAALESVLEAETAHLRAGRLRDGLAGAERKDELAGAYLQGLEACKANAIALARFAPDEVDTLKAAHTGFQRAVERNQVVLATARAVSEGLVRSLAAEMGRAARPEIYTPTSRLAPPPRQATPIICSKQL
jgi:uncharacterized protein (DUF2267 family)